MRERVLLFSEWVLTSDGLAIADASLLWFNVIYSSGFLSFSSLCAGRVMTDMSKQD